MHRAIARLGRTGEATVEAEASPLPAAKPPVPAKPKPAAAPPAGQSSARPKPAAAPAPPVEDPAAVTLRAMTGGDSAYREILAAGIPMPQLFPGGPAGGSLPHSTASGMAPQRLAAAPEWCRPAIKEEPTLDQAEELLAAAVDDPDIIEVTDGSFTRAAGYGAFVSNLQTATVNAGKVMQAKQVDAQIAAAGRQARAAAAEPAAGPGDEGDEAFDRLFSKPRAAERRGVELRNYWDGSPR